MISTETETVLVFDEEIENSEKDEIIEFIQSQLKEAKSRFDKHHLEDRLSKLAGGVATIRVSANSEIELKEKKDRVDDSIHATRAALQEGIVAGGGIALMDVYKILRRATPRSLDDSYVIGWKIMIDALPEVWNQLIHNSGDSVDDIIEGLGKKNYGWDVKNRKYGNMFTMGIIDPYKVTKNAVLNSASVASTILTTSCVISNKRIKK
jgi:chaperonin GroEL